MKKIFLTALVLQLISSVYAMDFSFSDQGLDVDGNVSRSGNNININYVIDGLDSPQVQAQMPNTGGDTPQISKIKLNMSMNCSTKMMKINSMDLLAPNGSSLQQVSNTDWYPIEKQADLQKLKEMCTKY